MSASGPSGPLVFISVLSLHDLVGILFFMFAVCCLHELYMTRQVSMISNYHIHTLQTNPRHREEVP